MGALGVLGFAAPDGSPIALLTPCLAHFSSAIQLVPAAASCGVDGGRAAGRGRWLFVLRWGTYGPSSTVAMLTSLFSAAVRGMVKEKSHPKAAFAGIEVPAG